MSTYIDPKDMEAYLKNDEYVVIDFKIRNANKQRAERIINDMRKLHNKLGCFVKHTCLCDDELDCTIWRFLYNTSEEDEHDIFHKICDIWDTYLGDMVKSKNCSQAPIDFDSAHACMCPFSAK